LDLRFTIGFLKPKSKIQNRKLEVTMLVMFLEKVPTSLRGELTRWLLEPRPGVFVGHVSALVRERLWEKCIEQRNGQGGIIQIWSTNTEQRFDIRTWGDTERQMVNIEGIWLVQRLPRSAKNKDKGQIDSPPPPA
jgi:CRISPR-associated protein Cas2